METRPILFFDSGIGGLSVVKEARILLPGRPYVYVADDAAFPYGAWEEEALLERMVGLFADLLDTYRPVMSVIARRFQTRSLSARFRPSSRLRSAPAQASFPFLPRRAR